MKRATGAVLQCIAEAGRRGSQTRGGVGEGGRRRIGARFIILSGPFNTTTAAGRTSRY